MRAMTTPSTETTRHEDEVAIEAALGRLQRTGRADMSDGDAKRIRYALDGATQVLDEQA